MGVSTNGWSIAQYLAAAAQVGLPPSNFVPSNLQSLCASVAGNSIPPSAPADFALVCQASLIARGIIYFKSSPGDCGTPTPLNLGNAQLAGEAGQIASGIASMAGASLPGIGVAVQAIQQIFANHAAAVQKEQTTICQVALVINQVIPYYDAQVRAGNISPSTAYAGMQNFIAQVTEQLDGIKKTCDAACVYEGILNAHSRFVQQYWPQIAPPTIAPHAPGAPPSTLAPTAPGGVVSVGAAGNSPQSVASPTAVAQTLPSDFFGNKVTLNSTFFSSSLGTQIVGKAGQFLNASQLATIDAAHPDWNLSADAPMSNGVYAQINEEHPGWLKGPSGLSANDLTIGLIVLVILALLFFAGRKGNAIV
jgi:hypothetical protein